MNQTTNKTMENDMNCMTHPAPDLTSDQPTAPASATAFALAPAASTVVTPEFPLAAQSRMRTQNLNVFYGTTQALYDVALEIPKHQVTALIGPSGCGKSTYLRCLNRMNDVIDTCRIEGTVQLDDMDIYGSEVDVVELRARIGMVFQKPNPFPKSIYDNVAYGPRIHGLAKDKHDLDRIVMESLEQSRLFDEVKDRMHAPGTSLSGGQQQRLCIARAIAVKPEVILMDEPCSALDPIATAGIEALIGDLKDAYTIIMVTHSMQQAARVSQKTAYFHMGHLVETGSTEKVFTDPVDQRTRDYVTGRIG